MAAIRVEGLSLAPGRVMIVTDPGGVNELVFVNGSSDLAVLGLEVSRRTGSDAQKLSATLLDYGGAYWRRLGFGKKIRCYLDGKKVFAGVMTQPARDVLGGTAIMLEVMAVGRTQVLYSEPIKADKTYRKTDATTGDTKKIAKDIVDGVFAGVLTSTNMAGTSGTVISEFEVLEGENVGEALERLAKLDGHTFEVDEDDDVRYYKISTTPQATITEEDLVEQAGQRLVEEGALPPRNLVHILGSSGYLEKTLQEQQDSYSNLDGAAKAVGQSFKATSARLSAIDLKLDRTQGTNEPAALKAAIYPSGKNVTADATVTVSSPGVWTDGANVFDGNESTYGYTTSSTGGTIIHKFDFGTAKQVYGAHIKTSADRGTIDVHLEGSSDDSTWTTVASKTNITQAELRAIWAASTTAYRYWRTRCVWTDSGSSVEFRIFELRIFAPGWDAARYNVPASYGGDANADYHRVEFSEISITASANVPYPPEWTLPSPTYAKPKLALTKDNYYWFVAYDTAATASKYWRVGYYAASDAYADGKAHTFYTTGQGWTVLNHDLAFRLYWSHDDVDVTVTKARAKLSGAMTDSQNTIPVDKVDDFAEAAAPLADRTVKIGTEEITYTGKSVTSGAGNLTGGTRGANGTTAAAHSSGDQVVAEGIKEYGVWMYEDRDESITTEADAKAVASVLLTKHRHPTTRMTLPLRDPNPDLTPRAVVTVKRPLLDINGDYEVAEVHHELTERGLETSLVIGAKEYNAASALEEVRKKL